MFSDKNSIFPHDDSHCQELPKSLIGQIHKYNEFPLCRGSHRLVAERAIAEQVWAQSVVLADQKPSIPLQPANPQTVADLTRSRCKP